MRWFFNKLTPARLERRLWYLFLVVLPWQTRFIFWQADRQFIEWRSMAFYLSDALLLALFALAIGRGWLFRIKLRRSDIWLAGIVAAAIVSLAAAPARVLAFWQVLRLVEFIVFFLYLRSWAFRRFDADMTAAAFVAGALIQSVLALAQYVLQHDVGIRWMGETLLRTDMHGVAVFYDLAREKILRAYGTLPHPNVLAAYLALALWATGWLYIRHGREHRAIWGVCGALLLAALYLTYSRTMIFFWLMSTVAIAVASWWPRVSRHWPEIKPIRQRLKEAVILIGAVSVIFLLLQWPRVQARLQISADDESVRLRVTYARDALGSGGGGLHLNWTGIGIGNFTTWLAGYDKSLPPFLYQPAHNLFLLIYSEMGLLGISVWSVWLVMLVRDGWRRHAAQPFVRFSLLAILAALLGMAMFDHFFWTLQQGRLMWWVFLALLA